jgi:hypothetical protein
MTQRRIRVSRKKVTGTDRQEPDPASRPEIRKDVRKIWFPESG